MPKTNYKSGTSIVLNTKKHTVKTETRSHTAIPIALSSVAGGEASEAINTPHCATALLSRRRRRSHIFDPHSCEGTETIKFPFRVSALLSGQSHTVSRDGVVSERAGITFCATRVVKVLCPKVAKASAKTFCFLWHLQHKGLLTQREWVSFRKSLQFGCSHPCVQS